MNREENDHSALSKSALWTLKAIWILWGLVHGGLMAIIFISWFAGMARTISFYPSGDYATTQWFVLFGATVFAVICFVATEGTGPRRWLIVR